MVLSDSATVSVIIPIYNAQPFLEQCLESVCAQTYSNLDIICLNDGSTDSSLSIMKKYASADKRLRVIDKPNQGYGATCNRGLEEAYGEWIAIVEPDDWVEEGMFADMFEFAQHYERADIIKTPYWRIVNPDTPQQRKLNCSYKHRVKPKAQPFAVADAPHLLMHHPSIWSALYRAEFLKKKGVRFKEIPGAGWADNPFLVETLCQTDRIVYLDRAYYCYREETEEKSAAFAERNTLVPFERWHDMMDVLDRLGVSDCGVMDAMIRRAFRYLDGVRRYTGDRADVTDAAKSLFERMDAEQVLQNSGISPDQKRLFARLRGLPEPKTSKIQWMGTLVKEACYATRNAGIGHTLSIVKNVL